MSSNTLRGIGQEEDGETDAAASGKGVAKTAAAPANAAPATADLTDRVPDPQKLTSLDSTIPGTRSLDSSVPEARPSLDAKVPHLASTLLGVMAPPVDRISAAGSDATPQPFEHSEPTRADPVRTAALAQEANDRGGAVPQAARATDSNSHGPWYDQDPTAGDEVYEDEKPSVLGRAAIGVAVAAGLSVVVFAVLRMTANSEEGYRRPPPVVFEPSTAPARPVAAPSVPPSSVATRSAAAEPAAAAPGAGDAPVPGEAPSPPAGPGGSARPAAAGADTATSPAARPKVVRVGPTGARPGGRALAPGRPAATGNSSRIGSPPGPGGAVISAPSASHIAAGTVPPPLSRTPTEVAAPPAPSSLPAAPKPAAATGTDRPRGKAYDPDSTLPLNFD